ncbi:MAG: SusD/RagB family nutrient-binding outer membrane lipoprotein, partial [Dysgonamonadaceae bacterium]|nr:SusD/RagB family nutrient-binding outer membrane lipoprotein [Dysgonamonadaceae bacterium]
TLRDLQSKADELGSRNMLNVAKVLEVHVMSLATDRWRDVPYSDAINLGAGAVNPQYDRQEDIYPALLALLKEVADDWGNNGIGDDDISTGDLLYGGDVELWQRYANSLRLRLATRISDVSASLAKQTIEEIAGNPSKYPIIDDNDDNTFFWWDANDASRFEPLADAYRTRPGVEFCAPDVMIDNFKANNDPRLSKYFEPAASDGGYHGYIIGAAANTSPSGMSHWSYKYEQDLGGFSPWYRAAENWFYYAEAATRGWSVGFTAKAAYEKGVTASMEENDISAAEISAYLAGAGAFPTGTVDQQRKKLYYELWAAMFKQGMEGWSLYRRTGQPDFLYVAPGRAIALQGHHWGPLRSPYPDTERNLNTANNKPFNDEVIDDLWGKQMWWDQRTGVNN